MFGGVIAYQHWWDPKWDSNFVYSYASVDNADAQAPDAYHTAHYAAANLRWHPAERVMVGVEYLYGVGKTTTATPVRRTACRRRSSTISRAVPQTRLR